MQIPSRFTIAIHTLACIDYFADDYKVTSDFIAGSVGVNPVVIRKVLQQLKKAGLVDVRRGSGGAYLARTPEDITVMDIYDAVEPTGRAELFKFHEHPNPDCPVGSRIHAALDGRLQEAQDCMRTQLSTIKLSGIIDDIRHG